MDLERLEKLPSAETLKKILASPTHPLEEGIHALILDTNVLLDLLYWRDSKVAGLLPKIAKENALVLFDEETLFEFADVIAREQFKLSVKEQEETLQKPLHSDSLSKRLKLWPLCIAKIRTTRNSLILPTATRELF